MKNLIRILPILFLLISCTGTVNKRNYGIVATSSTWGDHCQIMVRFDPTTSAGDIYFMAPCNTFGVGDTIDIVNRRTKRTLPHYE